MKERSFSDYEIIDNCFKRISKDLQEMVRMMEQKMEFTYESYLEYDKMKNELLEDLQALEFYIKGMAKRNSK